MTAGELKERYRVIATKQAKSAGKKLLGEKDRLWLIRELITLKYWPDNANDFDHEKVYGAIKFDFYLEQKWIRVFVVQDDVRKVMWVVRAFAKKTNQLTTAQQISVQTAVGQIRQEIKVVEKRQKQLDPRTQMRVIEGGRK